MDTTTVVRPIADILRLRHDACSAEIINDSDVTAAVSRFVDYFQNVAIPYFARFATIKMLDSVVNDHPLRVCVDIPGVSWFRCSKGLIAAKLTKRSNYKELLNLYQAIVAEKTRGFYLPKFIALRDSLEDSPKGTE